MSVPERCTTILGISTLPREIAPRIKKPKPFFLTISFKTET